MPQIGWFELLIIVVVAILVIGPKDFPIVLKKIGTWFGTIKRYISDIQQNVSEVTNTNIIEEENVKIKKEKKDETN
jgi:sec-independent protein translocase protein TatB|tara:strand:- start:2444 stop:2671 length:228 start_codon:yes stop_codon:yes gene_type:complete